MLMLPLTDKDLVTDLRLNQIAELGGDKSIISPACRWRIPSARDVYQMAISAPLAMLTIFI